MLKRDSYVCVSVSQCLISQVQEQDGVSLTKHKRIVCRAREVVNQENVDAQNQTVGKLLSSLVVCARLNPSSVATVELDGSSRFKLAIIIVKIFADSSFARQRVLGVDWNHKKCSLYSGVQMRLVGRDGNVKNTTIAFALVPAEDSKAGRGSSRISRNLATLSGIPMFCNRGTSLISVAEEFELDLKFCTLHILKRRSPVRHAFATAEKLGVM